MKIENKFDVGAVVYQKINPSVKLIIRRYVDRIYYCKFQNDPERKELALFERELTDNPTSR
ncbi:hypothetical protein [Fulvivirga ligni]|uniref:hypothetical protein n=1 Tax=Fulvivirga ligni TaxID=2904246 RepID=UPI001F35C681|nr:hypothetical protein [Fulvivirga ligni]UII21168.1 hypothetical protein LVD16_25360 [Fulvivirga ligni]